jgi:4-amino-4-deoxy-L-arabinose transferase-like glycosyltransferase
VVAWIKKNSAGLVVAFTLTVVVGLAVEPALRVLSDEANQVGTSKNFFSSKTATYTVSGKNYNGSYWDVDVAVDRRPTLFPFLVSLVHAVCGYSYKNVFLFNLLVLAAFLVVAYRLAKSLGGETFAVVATLFVAAHPVTLISARSGGFDLLATFFGLLVIKSLLEYLREQSAAKLAILWMNLCMFAQIRYESALFIPPVVILLLLFKLVTWSTLRPYAFVYALTPAYLLPRIWQSILRGNVPEQDPGTVTFSVENFLNNVHEYFKPLLSPFQAYPSHSAVLIALGVVGSLSWLGWLLRRFYAKDWRTPQSRFAVFVLVWILLQAIIVFTYVWGRAQYPSAARLVMAIDTFFSFAAAWVLTQSLRRWRPFLAILPAVALLAMELPAASQHRTLNRLTQTRESATTWSFFERLNEKRILVVTDRPNHFTIMDYGAMDFETARRDPHLFTAFARRLFRDVYVIQQIKLSTNEPLPGYEIWPDRKLDVVLEFQNDADVLVRISRLAR